MHTLTSASNKAADLTTKQHKGEVKGEETALNQRRHSPRDRRAGTSEEKKYAVQRGESRGVQRSYDPLSIRTTVQYEPENGEFTDRPMETESWRCYSEVAVLISLYHSAYVWLSPSSLITAAFNRRTIPLYSSAMPLFSWMKWLRAEGEQAQDEAPSAKSTGVLPSCTLIRELLWHVEERERLAREVEREHRLAHNTVGYPHWLQSYPRLRTLIPASERHQLERLCAQIQPMHTATVLSRFREVLASNNILPWELVYVFKQVLRDFLNIEEGEEEEEHLQQPALHGPMEAWTNQYQMKQDFVTPTVPNCGEPLREEIPTISGYVDRTMRGSSPFTAHRDWDLPYYHHHPVQHNSTEAYSTML